MSARTRGLSWAFRRELRRWKKKDHARVTRDGWAHRLVDGKVPGSQQMHWRLKDERWANAHRMTP